MRKGEFAMRAQNLTLLTDLYELTMMQGYYENPSDQIVVFDAFYRKNPCGGAYAVCAGLEQVIEYVRDLHFSPDDIDYLRSLHIFNDDFLEYLRGFHFTGDIYAIPEGTVVFPREPLLKVVAPIMEAQLVETALLNLVNHQTLAFLPEGVKLLLCICLNLLNRRTVVNLFSVYEDGHKQLTHCVIRKCHAFISLFGVVNLSLIHI